MKTGSDTTNCNRLNGRKGILLGITSLIGAITLCASICGASYATDGGSTDSRHKEGQGKTKKYTEKGGFERTPKDIINTLKDNEITQFQTLRGGLEQAFGLDKTLKGKGPFTFFAASDKAFTTIPGDDVQSLFANKKKLKQVLTYHVIEGSKLSSDALRTMKGIKTMEGHELKFSEKGGSLYVDKALVKISDVPCSNGVIHVIDSVLMPPLSQ